MKKITSVILILVLFTSVFSACSKDSSSTTTSTDSSIDNTTDFPVIGNKSLFSNDSSLGIGDSIATEDIIFTLTDVTYGTNLSNYPKQDDYMYELSEEDAKEASKDKAYKADDGEGYVVLVYDLENTGNDSFLYEGNTVLKYKGEIYEEYPYSNDRFNVKLDDGFEAFLEYTFEPGDKYELRVCYSVPYEILENENEPLEVIATFDKEYTFKVR